MGVYNASILTLAQDDLNTSNATYGPFTVTNTPPFTNISYYIISILTVVITSEMDGLVLSCSSQNLLQPPFTINPVGNVTISLIGKTDVCSVYYIYHLVTSMVSDLYVHMYKLHCYFPITMTKVLLYTTV